VQVFFYVDLQAGPRGPRTYADKQVYYPNLPCIFFYEPANRLDSQAHIVIPISYIR